MGPTTPSAACRRGVTGDAAVPTDSASLSSRVLRAEIAYYGRLTGEQLAGLLRELDAAELASWAWPRFLVSSASRRAWRAFPAADPRLR